MQAILDRILTLNLIGTTGGRLVTHYVTFILLFRSSRH